MEIRIRHDLYDVADRLHEINPAYEVYFDTERDKYVIKAFGVPQCTIPYDKLDQRTIDYVLYTRVENVENVLRDVDRHNETKEKEAAKKLRDDVEDEVSRRLRRPL